MIKLEREIWSGRRKSYNKDSVFCIFPACANPKKFWKVKKTIYHIYTKKKEKKTKQLTNK